MRSDLVEIDARGAAVIPGFVDAHTHLAYAGDRDDEIRARLAGATYEEISSKGGGIVKTVAATRAVSLADLSVLVRARLDRLLALGTTTAEVKSGYGLPWTPRTLKRHGAASIIRRGADGLGAHEVPLDRRSDARPTLGAGGRPSPKSRASASLISRTCSASAASSV
jgi:imidazolonepropionase